MEVEEEAFWRSLRKQIDGADDEAQRELLDAEAELQQMEAELAANDATDAAEQLPPEQVDRWVADALAQDAHALAQAHRAPQQQQRRANPWQSWLVAAAAFLITPKFLVAATIAAGIAVAGALLQRTTETLPFEQAVILLLDEQQSHAIREAAGGRVYLDVAESILVLQEVANQAASGDASTGHTATLAKPAQMGLDRLRQTLKQASAGTGPTDQQLLQLEPAHFQTSMAALGDQVIALETEATLREQSLAGLVEQIEYGMQAMLVVRTRPGTAQLRTSNEAQLRQIESLLSR